MTSGELETVFRFSRERMMTFIGEGSLSLSLSR